MLPRLRRLRRQGEIRAVMKNGKRIQTPWVRVYALPTLENRGRIACVVGKTVDPSAVTRHHYQRYLREAARALIQAHPAFSYDMVWVATPRLKELPTWSEFSLKLTPYVHDLFSSPATRSL